MENYAPDRLTSTLVFVGAAIITSIFLYWIISAVINSFVKKDKTVVGHNNSPIGTIYSLIGIVLKIIIWVVVLGFPLIEISKYGDEGQIAFLGYILYVPIAYYASKLIDRFF